MDSLTDEAALAGAVNVIRRNHDGSLVGALFDGEGFVAGLAASGHPVRGKDCLLAGTGGAGSAVAFALLAHGCHRLHLANRTPSRKLALAEKLRQFFPHALIHIDEACGPFDISINATPLGMKVSDPLPFSREIIRQSALVAECVVAPEMTPLLEAALEEGKPVHQGVSMLSVQMVLMLDFMLGN